MIPKIDRYNNLFKTDKEYIETISTVINPQDNGGQSITLSVDVFKSNYSEMPYTYSEINLQCYGTHTCTIGLSSIEDLLSGCQALVSAIKSSEAPQIF